MFFLFFFFNFIYLFIFGCVGSSLLHVGSLQPLRAGATPRGGARASHCGGLFRCGAQAPGAGPSSRGTRAQQPWLAGSRAQAQQWLTGLATPRHAGSSRIRA